MKSQSLSLSVPLGEFACQIIQKNFHRFSDQEKAVLKDKDSEPLHQMRVGMRRLRIAIKVFTSAMVLPSVVCEQSIGKIAKWLGKTRDFDVLQDTLLTRYQPALLASELAKFQPVLHHLTQRRRRSFRELKTILKDDRYRMLCQAIQEWLEMPNYTPMGHLPVVQVLPDLLLPLVCQLLLHPGWLVGATMQAGAVQLIPLDEVEALRCDLEQQNSILHDLRKVIKGVRYQAEFFSDFYESTYLHRIEDWKTIQDRLGGLQDQMVLCRFLNSTLGDTWMQDLPTIAHMIQQEKTEFWYHWQPLQREYLNLDFRRSLRLLFNQPLDSALIVL